MATFFSKLRVLLFLAREYGWMWPVRRILYSLRLRTGWFRLKLPPQPWTRVSMEDRLVRGVLPIGHSSETRPSHKPRFPARNLDQADYRSRFGGLGPGVLSAIEELKAGFLSFFSAKKYEVGFPPRWCESAFTGEAVPTDVHWSRLGDFTFGDIKAVWEPNRFSFVYLLVRGYAQTSHDSIPEIFWKTVEDWAEKNPPQMGPNWKCGQEIALRTIAWAFGFHAFEGCSCTTSERRRLLLKLVAVSAERIEANLEYAVEQKSNHGHSEAAGLFTVGVLFPELRQSDHWRMMGAELLEDLAEELVYEDGNCCMQSFNYLRAIADLLLWVSILSEANGLNLRPIIKNRLKAIGLLLFQCQDKETGQVPVYGSNDGALLFPLTSCDFLDFRPLLQSIWIHCNQQRLYPAGPWDEQAFWLRGSLKDVQEIQSQLEPQHFGAPESGFYVLRSERAFAFVRCGRLKHRPSHADQLHVDIWWNGLNVACDAGTFSYNNSEPFKNGLKHTEFHNTVGVDRLDQMTKVGRFLWADWARGFSSHFGTSERGDLSIWEGWHDGYERLRSPVRHSRAIIQVGDENFIILDRLTSSEEHNYALHWLLTDFPYHHRQSETDILLQLDAGNRPFHVAVSCAKAAKPSIARAVSQSARGWRSRYYQVLEPAISLRLETVAAEGLFASHFGPGPVRVEWAKSQVTVTHRQWEICVVLGADGTSIIERASLSGVFSDDWKRGDTERERNLLASTF